MDFSFGAEDEELRVRARSWLTGHLVGPFADALGLGGPGSEHEGSGPGARGSASWAGAAGSARAGRCRPGRTVSSGSR